MSFIIPKEDKVPNLIRISVDEILLVVLDSVFYYDFAVASGIRVQENVKYFTLFTLFFIKKEE